MSVAPGSVDPIGRRYRYKFLGNLVWSGSRVVVQAIVPRALGPGAYGDFAFLTNFFLRFVGFVGFGTPFALNTKVAQRPDDTGLTIFYTYFTGAVLLATMVFIAACGVLSVDGWLWPGQQRLFIWAAALWALLTWMSQVVLGVADARGRTVRTEMVRLWQGPLSAGLVAVMMVLGWLTLSTLFLYHYVVLAAMTLTWLVILQRAGASVVPRRRLTAAAIRRYLEEFYQYSAPLAVYTAASFLGGAGERWLLQTHGGSIEQGFFGLSFQIGTICFMFSSAMTPVMLREFSVAAGLHDVPRLAALYRRFVPPLYAVAAVLSAFVATQADRIVLLFGGERFAGAAVPLAIMAFYPVHQTYGQLNGSLFYATGQTRLHRNIGVASMTLGLGLAYWVIAPPAAGGLGAGATGLAVKMIVMQLAVVNVQLYFSARLLGLRLRRYLAHQVVGLGCPVALALLVRFGSQLLDGRWPAFVVVCLSGLAYLGLVAGLLAVIPRVFGLSRSDLRKAIGTARRLLGETGSGNLDRDDE